MELWRAELQGVHQPNWEVEYRKRLETFLDRGEGHSWLKERELAQLVQESLLFFDAQRYRLHAWVVMPNHIHTLITPAMGERLERIIQSWKSSTAKAANRLLGREGLDPEYHDRFIRNSAHFSAAVSYIENNPVKAGLYNRKEDWEFSSARLRLRGD